jgi:hypothetical protein
MERLTTASLLKFCSRSHFLVDKSTSLYGFQFIPGLFGSPQEYLCNVQQPPPSLLIQSLSVLFLSSIPHSQRNMGGSFVHKLARSFFAPLIVKK